MSGGRPDNPQTDPEVVTIREAITAARSQVPALEARLLMEAVLGVGYSYLIAHDREALAPEQLERYLAAVKRVATGEPLPYVTGRAPFYGRSFVVSPAVLIPRPETELLVERGLAFLTGRTWPSPPRAIDVGTGSGCIPLTLACECRLRRLPIEIEGVDRSSSALAVAEQNRTRLRADLKDYRVEFYQSDLLQEVDGPFDLILANLPYVSDAEWVALDRSVREFEPEEALRGGRDGLDLIRRLLAQARTKLRPGGMILLEIGWRQGESGRRAAEREFPSEMISCIKDLSGHDRIIEVRLK